MIRWPGLNNSAPCDAQQPFLQAAIAVFPFPSLTNKCLPGGCPPTSAASQLHRIQLTNQPTFAFSPPNSTSMGIPDGFILKK
jgi:hypothetical protein